MGSVSALGWGVPALRRGLWAGVPPLRGFGRFDHTPHRTHIAGEVPRREERSSRADRRLTHADLFALSAAREALAEAGIDPPCDRRMCGIFFGSSTGGMFETEAFYRGVREDASRRRTRLHQLVSQQPNGPADSVARAFGVTGPVHTVSSACASGTQALGMALDAVRAGDVEVALAGGADSLCEVTYAGFNSLQAVDERPCRPFREDRAGLSLGEGAAVLVLERMDAARSRGAKPLARVKGAATVCDAHHMTAPEPSGERLAECIRAALEDAEQSPEGIGFVNAHGTGTPLSDAAEWTALQLVFGERARSMPVTSTKGCVGHLLGSAGAIEAVASIVCLQHCSVHPTPGAGNVDPALGVDLVRGEGRAIPASTVALSTSLAFGGADAAVVLAPWEEP